MTTPKLPPPPRNPQNRSGCSSLGGVDDPPVGEHHLGRQQRVDGQAEAPHQPPHAAAQRQPAGAGVRDDADGYDQAVGLGGRVDVAQRRPAADPDRARVRIDLDVSQRAQVDDDAAVDGRMAGQRVAAAADGDRPRRVARA